MTGGERIQLTISLAGGTTNIGLCIIGGDLLGNIRGGLRCHDSSNSPMFSRAYRRSLSPRNSDTPFSQVPIRVEAFEQHPVACLNRKNNQR